VAHQRVRIFFPPLNSELSLFPSHTITIHRWPGTITLRSQARAPHFHMHPLHPYTRLPHAPISRHIHTSAHTVVDCTLHSPLLAVTLAQPVTEPPIPSSSRLVLRSPKLPWVVVVVVCPIGSPPSFFIGKDGREAKGQKFSCAHEPRCALCPSLHADDLRHARGVAFSAFLSKDADGPMKNVRSSGAPGQLDRATCVEPCFLVILSCTRFA
jgi:hypothetical protein